MYMGIQLKAALLSSPAALRVHSMEDSLLSLVLTRTLQLAAGLGSVQSENWQTDLCVCVCVCVPL